MTVDLLRSCYQVNMRFFRDDPRSTLVQWYFVDDDTPVLPYETIFSSHNWDDERTGGGELGEVDGEDRVWVNGARVGDADGLAPCGTADQFLYGDSLPPVPATPLDPYGTPNCCGKLAPPFVGACQDCFPGGVWSDYTLVVQNATSSFINCAGNWRMRFGFPLREGTIAGCYWLADRFFATVPETIHFPQWVLLSHGNIGRPCDFFISFYSPGSGYGETYELEGWDWFSLFVAHITQPNPGNGAPDTIRILPGIPPGQTAFCNAFGGFLPTAYEIVVPTTNRRRGYFTIVDTYVPVSQIAPCLYQGSARIVGFTGVLSGRVRVQMLVGANGAITLFWMVEPSLGVPPVNLVKQYRTAGPWNGTDTIAVMGDPSPIAITWPDAMQVFWPGNL